jgi:hypothetical protein
VTRCSPNRRQQVHVAATSTALEQLNNLHEPAAHPQPPRCPSKRTPNKYYELEILAG